MKKTVVVIDDKPIIRRAIVQTTNWEELGCEVVAQAEDGLEGMQMIEEHRPDILITDIKMPGKSGLELAEWMQKEYPHTKTILITGYQEFEYAKQAVKLGAFDFIVKPINNQEFNRVVQAAVNKLNEEEEQKRQSIHLSDEVSRLSQMHQDTLPSLRSKWLEDRLNGLKESVAKSEGQQTLRIEFSRFVVTAFRPISPSDDVRAVWTEKRDEFVRHATDLYRKQDIETIPVFWNRMLVLFCMFNRVPNEREANRKLRTAAAQWIAYVQQTIGASARAAISGLYRMPAELEAAGAEVLGLHESGFFRSDEPILTTENEREVRARIKLSVMQDIERFEQSLAETSLEQLQQEADQLFEQINLYASGNTTVAKGLISKVCLSAVHHYYQSTGNEAGLGKSVNQILEEVNQLGSLKEAHKYVAELLAATYTKLESDEKEYSAIIKSILDYIHTHYAEPISLAYVSEKFGISSGYLSRLIRSETGENFVDILAKVRIQAAKRLLRDPKYKVNEVGELVGYKEYAYFYQVFKRQAGCSPKEFKNKR